MSFELHTNMHLDTKILKTNKFTKKAIKKHETSKIQIKMYNILVTEMIKY